MAEDPRIDALRGKIRCHEDPDFTRDYHDPEKRSIANALTVEFADGSRPMRWRWSTLSDMPGGAKRASLC